MANFTIKQHDTQPVLQATLQQTISGATGGIDLTAATSVKLLLRAALDNVAVSRPAIITTPAMGVVTVNWQAADTATADVFNAEFEITWANGGIQTVPNDSYFTVEVKADLG